MKKEYKFISKADLFSLVNSSENIAYLNGLANFYLEKAMEEPEKVRANAKAVANLQFMANNVKNPVAKKALIEQATYVAENNDSSENWYLFCYKVLMKRVAELM